MALPKAPVANIFAALFNLLHQHEWLYRSSGNRLRFFCNGSVADVANQTLVEISDCTYFICFVSRACIRVTGDVSAFLPNIWSEGADGKEQAILVSIAATLLWPVILAGWYFRHQLEFCIVHVIEAVSSAGRFLTRRLSGSGRVMILMPAVCAISSLMMSPTASGNKQIWGIVKSGERVNLFYGLPESDAVTLSFNCNAGTKRLVIVSTVVGLKPHNGQNTQLVLSNASSTKTLNGKIRRYAEVGFQFEASIEADQVFFQTLIGGTASLTISVQGARERVSLNGVTKPLAQFKAACFGSPGKG